jgi:hypothetical protein
MPSREVGLQICGVCMRQRLIRMQSDLVLESAKWSLVRKIELKLTEESLRLIIERQRNTECMRHKSSNIRKKFLRVQLKCVKTWQSRGHTNIIK